MLQVENLQAEIKRKDERVKSVEVQMSKLREELASKSKSLDAAKSELSQLKQQVQDQLRELQESRAQLLEHMAVASSGKSPSVPAASQCSCHTRTAAASVLYVARIVLAPRLLPHATTGKLVQGRSLRLQIRPSKSKKAS
jgi:septal ring factor EnvC (AmiA/AmiB activator)